jgi:hypothetical protein
VYGSAAAAATALLIVPGKPGNGRQRRRQQHDWLVQGLPSYERREKVEMRRRKNELID